MKTARQAQREARKLFRICLVNGLLDQTRARTVVRRMVDSNRPGTLPVLTRFQRLLRLDRTRYNADVKSAEPLPPDVQALLKAEIEQLRGPNVVVSFSTDPALLGGVRITVGSDVYDGTIQGELAALEASL